MKSAMHEANVGPADLLAPLLEYGRAAVTPDELWASGVTGLGRSTIYAELHRYLETAGLEGIPCLLVGERKLLVPVARVAAWLGLTLESD